MNVIQQEILLKEPRDEYLIPVLQSLNYAVSSKDALPDRVTPIIVLVYVYSRKAEYGYIHKFIGARIQ